MNDATILIIDDEPSNIQTIINSLKISNYKYKLLSASNSKLGIEIATTVIPNLILIDWQMPELTGIEVIRKLKKNTKTCDIPIIMITGIRMTSEDLKIALESGAVDFIRKPIDEIELIARINSALTIVKYYTQKIIAENLVRKITEEKALLELEAKKRELLSYSTKLHHIVKLYETFAQKLTSDECVNCNL
ncbi:MAG: response regulator [Bacteroidia bacterium]|nr:response regulator [Bacteroidia bacterium]